MAIKNLRNLAWHVGGFWFNRTWKVTSEGAVLVKGRGLTRRSALRQVEQIFRIYSLMDGLLDKTEAVTAVLNNG